jgi:hypothetical protein
MEQLMKRILLVAVAGFVLTSILSSVSMQAQSAQSPSLGDYARSVKKNKPDAKKSASKVYDNDTLPRDSSLSVVGTPSVAASVSDQEKDPESTTTADEKAKDKKKAEESGQIKPGQSPEERQKAIDTWKQKIDDQKAKVDLLSRELNVLTREYQIKTTEFYANTAARVQNPNGFEEEDAKYKKEIAEKQKSADDAKSKLSDMQEEARKSGVPNSAAE